MTAVDPPIAAITVLGVVLVGLLGLGAGHAVNRVAGRFPWSEPGSGPALAVRPPVVELGTALLFVLTTLRFGLAVELPAFLFLAAVGVLLAVIDLRHHLLPNRVVLPSIPAGAALLAGAALVEREWESLARAGLGAIVLFAVFLVMAVISPSGLGWGDVKLAALLGLYLGWVGWAAVVVGGAAGFVLQALVALLLLAGRRIGLRSDLPFGPAMLLGAAVAIGWSDALLR